MNKFLRIVRLSKSFTALKQRSTQKYEPAHDPFSDARSDESIDHFSEFETWLQLPSTECMPSRVFDQSSLRRLCEAGSSRRSGAGRKSQETEQPGLETALVKLIESGSRVDTMSPLGLPIQTPELWREN